MKKVLIAALLASAVTAQAWDGTFESLSTGALDTQDGWIIDAAETSLSTVTSGTGGNYLALSGSSVPSPKMNRWIANSVTLTGSTYVGLDFNITASGNADPSELFLGFNANAATNSSPWSAYVAIKYPNNGVDTIGIEGTGSGGVIADASVVLNTDLVLGALFSVDGSNIVNGISVWINPTLGGDGLPTNPANQSWSITGTYDLTAQNLFKLRAQNMPTTIDNISIIAVPEPSTYAAILGLLALGFVAWRRRK